MAFYALGARKPYDLIPSKRSLKWLTKKKIFTKELDPEQTVTERWHNSDILLFGGSAGAFKLLYSIVKLLPADLDKAVVMIIHRKRNFVSEIEKMFAENSRMPFREISDKDKIDKNTIYIAPANYHTLLEKGGYFSLDVSESLWYSKPSIDVTFESAADSYFENMYCYFIIRREYRRGTGLLN